MELVDLTFGSDSEGAPSSQPSPQPPRPTNQDTTAPNHGLSTPLRRLLDLEHHLRDPSDQQTVQDEAPPPQKSSGINTSQTLRNHQQGNTHHHNNNNSSSSNHIPPRNRPSKRHDVDHRNEGSENEDDLIIEGRRPRRKSKKYDTDEWATEFMEELSQQHPLFPSQQDVAVKDLDGNQSQNHHHQDAIIHHDIIDVYMGTDGTDGNDTTPIVPAGDDDDDDCMLLDNQAMDAPSIDATMNQPKREISIRRRTTSAVAAAAIGRTRGAMAGVTREEEKEEEFDRQNDALSKRGKKARKTAEEKAQEKLEKQRMREEKKAQQAAETAARKKARHFLSDKNILHYFSVVIDPNVMMNPLGPKIILAFQETHTLADHDHIKFSVSSTNVGNLPAIMWNRKVPLQEDQDKVVPDSQQTTATGGDMNYSRQSSSQQQQQQQSAPSSSLSTLFLKDVSLTDVEEKHVLLCFDAEIFVQRVLEDGLSSVFEILQQRCPDARVYILVHRLDQYLREKERADHRRAMGAGQNAAPTMFNRLPIDLFVNKMHIERPMVGYRDVSSAEEGAKYVVSLTKAIAKQILTKSEAIEMLANSKSGSNKTKSTAASLLASHPIDNHQTRTFMHVLCAIPSVGPQVAHALATKYLNLASFMEVLFDPSKTFNQKTKMIEDTQRTGGAIARRIGPKAARDIVEFFTCHNPNLLIHGD